MKICTLKKGFIILATTLLISSCGSGLTNSYDDMFGDDSKTTESILYEANCKPTDEVYKLNSSVDNRDGSANYEVFIRSFYDSDGDGIGDINGLISKLDYIKDLGFKNIWLMPFNPSSSYHGYDVQDYYEIHEDIGTIDDFKNLIKEADKRNIGIIMDLVINHCSTMNQMFIDSARDYYEDNNDADSKKDYFNWSENSIGGYAKHNNGYYYEARFSPSMPDLNLDNLNVRKEILKIVKHWIDLGVSGFRLDAVLYYYYGNDNDNIQFLSWLKEETSKIKEGIYFVGEGWVKQFNTFTSYYNSNIDSFFNFDTSYDSNSTGTILRVAKGLDEANTLTELVSKYEAKQKSINENSLSSYFLSNHDMNRVSASLNGYQAKLGAAITYLLPGTPYCYYGEEISLKGVRGDEQTDVLRRLPMIWDKDNKNGETKCPEPGKEDLVNNYIKNNQVEDGANDLLKDESSLTNAYKKILNVRNTYPFIKEANFIDLSSLITNYEKNIILYKLTYNEEAIIIAHNVSSKDRAIKVDEFASNILDTIDHFKRTSSLENGILSIPARSSVILQVK